MAVAGRQGALVVIRLDGINGDKHPVTVVDAAFYPDAIMSVFIKIDTHSTAIFAQFDADSRLRGQVLLGIGCSDNT